MQEVALSRSVEPHPSVSSASRLLGFAGLLPPAFCVVLLAIGRLTGRIEDGAMLSIAALIYGCAILSFLGGIWWGFAMRRTAGQGYLAGMSVVPSLIAAALPLAFVSGLLTIQVTMVALGSAILLTLLVDRRLVQSGETPHGWMELRVPLSAGLGTLTILAGILTPG